MAPLFAPALASAQPTDVVMPQMLEHPEPEYPEGAGAKGEVTVVLRVTVERDGSVSEAHVVTSGGPAFDEAAIVAVEGTWRFSPAMRGGAPQRAIIEVPVHFTAKEAAPPPAAPAPPPAPAAPRKPEAATAAPAAPPPKKPVETAALSEDEAPPEPAGVEVTVVGRPKPPSRGASDFNLRIGELAHTRKNASELLTLAPGILLTNEGGEGHAEQVFLRGFDAREGQDIEFTVGGVPINESGNLHGNGYADTHFIIPEAVETLHVLEGPFDPRQGNYAVAGSADYELGVTQRGLTARYTMGSFGTKRMLVLLAPGSNPHSFGAAEIYSSDGFGQNRDSKRATAMGQYEGKLGSKGTYRVLATAYASSYHSAGVLREDDYERGAKGFYDTYDPLQGGSSSRYSIAGDIETRSGNIRYKQQVFLTYRAMELRENFTGSLLDVQTPLQSPHAQRGDLLELDVTEVTLGARGSASLKGRALGQDQELELGYFARGDHADGTQTRIEGATGHPYHLETDLSSGLGDLGIYADAGLRPVSWLTVRGGLRGDLFAYDVLDNCAVQSVSHPSKTNPPGDASCLSQQDFGHYREPTQRASTATTSLLPRASIIVGPYKHMTLNASVGRGVRSVDPVYVTQDAKTPFASITAYEGGVAFTGGTNDLSIVARSILFQTKVDRDLIFSETAGRNVLGAGTTRTGWVGALRLSGAHFDLAGNATLVKSLFDDTHLLVPYVPDLVIRTDAAVFGDLPASIRHTPLRGVLGAGFTFVGHRPLPFGQRSDVIATLDGSATVAWKNVEVGLIVTNLLGLQYRLGEYNFASDFHSQSSPTLVPMRHFAAGAPRGAFGTVSLTFGGP